jgi:hypothetical protein
MPELGLSWDAIILTIAGVLAAYSIVVRRHKALATLVAAYIGYLVAVVWGPRLAGLFSADSAGGVWVAASVTPYMVSIALLLIVTFLLSSFMKLGGKRGRYGILEVIVYALLTVLLILVALLMLMPESMRAEVFLSSRIAPFVYAWREWVIALPVFAMVYFGVFRDEER